MWLSHQPFACPAQRRWAVLYNLYSSAVCTDGMVLQSSQYSVQYLCILKKHHLVLIISYFCLTNWPCIIVTVYFSYSPSVSILYLNLTFWLVLFSQAPQSFWYRGYPVSSFVCSDLLLLSTLFSLFFESHRAHQYQTLGAVVCTFYRVIRDKDQPVCCHQSQYCFSLHTTSSTCWRVSS